MVPRDYGSFACPGRCPALPYRMGQGATLDAKTPKAEPTGCSRCSGTRTQKPLRVHPFEGCAFPYFAKHRDSPCLLVKGADCAGVCLAVLAWLCPGLCVFCFSVLMGRSNTLTSPSGLARSFAGCRVASVGTCCPTYLPRALCSPRSLARVSGGGARGARSSCRLHVKSPANIMYAMRRGAGRVVARYPVERPRFSPWSPCCRRFCRLALRGIIADSPSTIGGAAGQSTCGFVFRGRFGLDSLLNLCKSERIAHPFHRVKGVRE